MKKSAPVKKTNFLTPEELSSWKISLLNMQLAQEKLTVEKLSQEIADMRYNLQKKTRMTAVSDSLSACKKEYDTIIKELSIDISGKIVNELTGEVLNDEM